jgi:hypothetical protein
MEPLDRARQRSSVDDAAGASNDEAAGGGDAVFTEDRTEEEALRARLGEDLLAGDGCRGRR